MRRPTSVNHFCLVPAHSLCVCWQGLCDILFSESEFVICKHLCIIGRTFACPQTLGFVNSAAEMSQSRFMSNSAADESRRYFRQYRRNARENEPPQQETQQRSGSRHKLYGCCGKRLSRCVCDFTIVERHLKKAEWQSFLDGVSSGELLTLADTVDVGPILQSIKERGVSNWEHLWFSCASPEYQHVIFRCMSCI